MSTAAGVHGRAVPVGPPRGQGMLVTARPEYDDVLRAAAAPARPVVEVLADAAAGARALLHPRP